MYAFSISFNLPSLAGPRTIIAGIDVPSIELSTVIFAAVVCTWSVLVVAGGLGVLVLSSVLGGLLVVGGGRVGGLLVGLLVVG